MARETTAARIRQAMAERRLRQIDVVQRAEFLSQKYGRVLTKNALSQYVNSKAEPKRDMIAMLADILDVDDAWLTGFDVPMQRKKTHFSESTRSNNYLRESDPIFDALNESGRKEFCRYGRYLTTLDEYKNVEAAPQITFIRHYLVPAAAGYASPIEGEDYEEIPLPQDAPANADYCITIRGDSMEPYIKDGQIVYVRRNDEMHELDVGIFFVDGDVFCKQWAPGYAGETYLLSANPKREDANITIKRDAGRNCVFLGKVQLKHKIPRPKYQK